MSASPSRLTALEPVRCLECRTEYAKPSGGGTLSTNPGCPHCGYVGWLPSSSTVKVSGPRDRSAADRLQRLLARSG